MKFKNKLAALLLVGTLVGGGGVAVVGTAAQAHTPTASATCEALTVDAVYYETKPGTPAVGEPTITVENPDYKPATEGTPSVWAVFSPNNSQGPFQGPPTYPTDERGTWQIKGELPGGHEGPDGVYQKNENGNGNWFYHHAAIPGTPAVGEPTITVTNPDYKPGTEANAAPNTVVVTINGTQVESTTFGTDYHEVFPFADKTVANTWTVSITAWNDPDGSKGWTKTISGTTTPCIVPPTNVVCEAPQAGPVGTNLNGLWGNVDTRSAGHYEYIEDGLHVWTDDASSQAKVSLGTPASFALKNTGKLDIQWAGSTPPPGLNLFVNFGSDGTGTLVYESVYGQDLWLTNGSSSAVKANAPVNGGGNGSQWHGTINQWLAKYPNAQVTGIAFSLGSGVKGDGVLSSVTAGCTVYTFDFAREVPPKPEDKVVYSEWVDGEFECDATEVPQTRTKSVTTFKLVENEWVAQAPVVTTEAGSRPLTAEEQEAANIECAGPQPENKIVFGDWKTGEFECGDTTVQITRSVTSTEFVREGAEWVEGESITTTQTETRALTDEEIESLDCAVVIPPTEKPTPKPVVAQNTDVLATTGLNPVAQVWLFTGGALAVALGALSVVFGLRRRQMGTTED